MFGIGKKIRNYISDELSPLIKGEEEISEQIFLFLRVVPTYLTEEGLLSFNSDYMVWYRRKTNMFVDPQNASTTTLVFFNFFNI